MGLRFRRSFKVAPGVRLNVSKSGVSTSLGVRGAHVTLGHGKVRQTVGIPGSGLSYTDTQPARSGNSTGVVIIIAVLIILAAIYL